ncbi:MAG: hypothetical protein U9R64_03040 [Pseudomonadota bacterium]|nr:hypothetical protein [Pseudomonadota bacterium]
MLSPVPLLLSACVGPPAERAALAPAPVRATPQTARPAPPPPAPQASAPTPLEWQYRPVAPGSWTYRAEGNGSVATFGSGAQTVTLRCDRASRRVSLGRAVSPQMPGGTAAVTLRTSYGAVVWPATFTSGASPRMVATRAASDTALDQLAYSRGKFALESAGQPVLILPAWAEIGRVIEDCRG